MIASVLAPMPRPRRARLLLLSILMALLLAGCSQQTALTATPEPTPTSIPARGVLVLSGATTASGEVVPARQAQLGFASSGRVQHVAVEVGDPVAEDDLLVALDNAAILANVRQAEVALARAQATLAELRAGPRSQEVAAAQARLDAAQAHLTQLSEAQPEQIAAARAELAAAKAHHDALYSEPNAAIVAAAWADVERAQASLVRLLNPASPSQLAEAEAHVRMAEAELDLLTAGARAEAIAVADLDVDAAEAELRRAEAALADTELRAPFAGTVTSLEVNPGEMVLLGQDALTLADLGQLQVETTDLSERDVARVTIGQPATIFVEALGTDVPGQVARIAPQATTIGGDVVYQVVIALDEQPEGLRWGMSVEVDIEEK